jgi:lipopolysaccharide/colanic/teichoic acid biosynthesis glycosyltransferase
VSDVSKEYGILNSDIEKTTLLNHEKVSKNRTGYRFVKRAIDITLSLLALVILSPVFLVTALCIKLDSPGSVFFNQLRAGKDGVPILVFKFRSMCKDADSMLKEMEEFKNLGAMDIKQRLTKDPRITKTGRVIRATSIDELPQLVNVLIGNMSLVGPRPLPTYEHEAMNEYQQKRTLVKPGLTCYWQVSGRSTLNEETRVALDYKYIQEQGLLIDIGLMLRTIPAVVSRRGAF